LKRLNYTENVLISRKIVNENFCQKKVIILFCSSVLKLMLNRKAFVIMHVDKNL